LRARPGATVAVPLSWAGLKKVESASAFDIRMAPKVENAWTEFFRTRQTIAPGAVAFMRKNGAR
jgi:DNA primase